MNSKQRRQIERKYTHAITLYVQDERYYQFDQRMELARQWCKKRIKEKNWIRQADWNSSTFKFVKESDAVYFGLTWL